MSNIESVSDDIRERVRRAVALIARRHEKLTIAAAQRIAGANRAKTGHLVRAYKAGNLPDPGTPDGGRGLWSKARTSASTAEPPKAPSGVQPARDEPDQAEVSLSALISGARTEEALAEAINAVAVQLERGAITHQTASAFDKLLGRQAALLKQHRSAPKEDPDAILLASKDGSLVLAAFERICGGERRAEVLEFVRAKLEEDRLELPAVDPLGAL